MVVLVKRLKIITRPEKDQIARKIVINWRKRIHRQKQQQRKDQQQRKII